MLNFDTPGPRRRGGDASAWLGFSAAKRSVAFSMPDGFIGGHGGRPFETPDLVLKLLVLEPRRRQRRVLLLVFFPKPLNLADQSANQPDQLGRAETLKQIVRAR